MFTMVTKYVFAAPMLSPRLEQNEVPPGCYPLAALTTNYAHGKRFFLMFNGLKLRSELFSPIQYLVVSNTSCTSQCLLQPIQ